MLWKAQELEGRSIQATDGDIGKLDQLYFDDESWVVRYLVAETGSWLSSEKELISPAFVEEIGRDGKLRVKLTGEQVENSPDIDLEKPISRQQETAYHDYYGMPYYWGVTGFDTAGAAGAARAEEEVARESGTAEREGDPHLRSTKEVRGYHIAAEDGEVGHVEDFLVDEQWDWAIRYVIVYTRNWLPGRKVLVAPQWIERVDWGEAEVYVDLSQDEVKNSPEWDPSGSIDREYEERLYGHYGRPVYWR
jgi:hypothetical protein